MSSAGIEGPGAHGQFFRAGVGIAVVDRAGRVLALERDDVPGAWQLPQGGLDPEEEPADAARRELEEETGLRWSGLEVLGEHPRWLAYELPPDARSAKTGRGQVHRWFVVRLTVAGTGVELSRPDPATGRPEFRASAWVGFDDLIRTAAGFRQPVYAEVAAFARRMAGTAV